MNYMSILFVCQPDVYVRDGSSGHICLLPGMCPEEPSLKCRNFCPEEPSLIDIQVANSEVFYYYKIAGGGSFRHRLCVIQGTKEHTL